MEERQVEKRLKITRRGAWVRIVYEDYELDVDGVQDCESDSSLCVRRARKCR